MSEREIRDHADVDRPYEIVRDVLCADPEGVLRAATRAAAAHAESMAVQLHAGSDRLHVGAEVALSVGEVEETGTEFRSSRETRIPIAWESSRHPAWFPLMSAVLTVHPLTPTETRIDFAGIYEPPLGRLGGAIDAAVGRRVAEASVRHLVADLERFLRENLA